jgi:hypothetical protein
MEKILSKPLLSLKTCFFSNLAEDMARSYFQEIQKNDHKKNFMEIQIDVVDKSTENIFS